MNEQKLKRWLRDSDAMAIEPVMPHLDANELERLTASRRVRRRGLAAVGIAASALAFALWIASSDQEQTRVALSLEVEGGATVAAEMPPVGVKVLQSELDALEREIDERKTLVAALRHADELERLNRELAELEADVPMLLGTSIRVEEARSQAAAVSLHYANTLASEFGEEHLAEAEYRTIASRYPGTTWSAAAQQALRSDAPSS